MGTWFKSMNQKKKLKKIMNYSKNSNEPNKKLMYFSKPGFKVYSLWTALTIDEFYPYSQPHSWLISTLYNKNSHFGWIVCRGSH